MTQMVKQSTFNVKVRHTSQHEIRLEENMQKFSASLNIFNDYKKKAKALAQKVVDVQMVEKFLEELLPFNKTDEVSGEIIEDTRTINKRNKVEELFRTGKGNEGKTAWDLYNGYTEWSDHFKSKNEETSFNASYFGTGAKEKAKALDFALALN